MRTSRKYMERADRLLLVLSDLELGVGGHMDDLPQSECIGDLLAEYNTPAYANQQIEVIFNGDTFDFLKIPVDGKYPYHITATHAQAKLDTIAAAHEGFFQGLRNFLTHNPERKIHFLAGNHDLELLFPSLKEQLVGLIGTNKQVFCHDWELDLGDVHIEHGHQKVGMFRVDQNQPFLQHKGETILNLPWGNVALLDALVPFKPLLYQFDRIKPKSKLFVLMPSLKSFITRVYWRYWTRDFWQRDPLKKLSVSMATDILSAMLFVSPDTILSPMKYRKALLAAPQYRVFLVGHEHEASWWSRCGRKLLYTGCFRNEFLLHTDEEGTPRLQLQPKIYAEIWMRGERTIRSLLVETDGPTPPPGYQPESILTQLPSFFQGGRLPEIPGRPTKETG